MKLLACGDFHSGHFAGLTPPEYQDRIHKKVRPLAKECWRWFSDSVAACGKFDALLVNGDLIEGSGSKSGGSELWASSRLEQKDAATAIIKHLGIKTVIITYGTAYHVGDGAEDFEHQVKDDLEAARYNVRISAHAFFEIGGVKFSAKHHCGSSSVPHGRFTAIARETLWNQLWAEHGRQPSVDVTLRSHVHYYKFAGDADRIAMTLPALQAAETKFGTRRCSGLVDFGFVVFDCAKGKYSWQAHLLKPAAEKARLWHI